MAESNEKPKLGAGALKAAAQGLDDLMKKAK